MSRRETAEESLDQRRPSRAATVQSEVWVPLLQAAFTGVLLATLVVWATKGEGHTDKELIELWLGFGLTAGLVAWIILLVDTRALLRWVETRIGRDLDGDGQVGQAQERLVFMDRERAREQASQERARDEWGSFISFVERLPVKGTSMAAWESELGRGRYVEYRDALVDYDLARWLSYKPDGQPNTSQGWELVKTPGEILALVKVVTK